MAIGLYGAVSYTSQLSMSDNRERDYRGQYVSTITTDDVLEVLDSSDDPVLTAKEVGELLGCSSEAARQRLHELQEEGDVKSKRVGARALIFWAADGDN